jgi:splicing factor U2AF subunit
MYQSPDAGFHGGVDQHGNIQQSDPRKLQEHFEVCA